MPNPVESIPVANLALAFVPIAIVIVIMWKWRLRYKHSIYATLRMLLQLLLVGYVLTYIFNSDSPIVISLVLTVMLFSASWIALRTIRIPKARLYVKSLASILIGGGLILFLITQGVLDLRPWYLPNYMIPLAGMIFANAMNSISLAAERLSAEMERAVPYERARVIAMEASLIPITNSLLAVGLVSLPGMMTGQILAGVSPFVASKYQIVVMCMIFGSAGISSAIFLRLIKSNCINLSM